MGSSRSTHLKRRAAALRVGATLISRQVALASILFLLGAVVGVRPVCAEPGDELTVSLLTLSPGEHPFARFGHIEIWIHNAAASPEEPLQRDPVYNFGNFTFDDPALIPKFILGRFVYWLAKEPLDRRIDYARRLERSMEAQELNLSAAQKTALLAALEENLQERNRFYKYDYYRDNCATRVRDIIDHTIGGRLQEASRGPAAMSWRAHTLRLTRDDVLLSLALTLVLAGFTDERISQWEEMFLASYIQKGVRRVHVPGPGGTVAPLVKNERTLLAAKRVIKEHQTPPSWLLVMLAAGLLWGGTLYMLARFASQHRLLRVSLAGSLVVASLLSAGGAFLCFVWVATDHEACHRNENILQLMPLGVAHLGLLRGIVRLDRSAVARARLLLTVAAVSALVGLFWKILPWMRQDNFWIIALCAPMWIGGALGLVALERLHPLRTQPAPASHSEATD